MVINMNLAIFEPHKLKTKKVQKNVESFVRNSL